MCHSEPAVNPSALAPDGAKIKKKGRITSCHAPMWNIVFSSGVARNAATRPSFLSGC